MVLDLTVVPSRAGAVCSLCICIFAGRLVEVWSTEPRVTERQTAFTYQ